MDNRQLFDISLIDNLILKYISSINKEKSIKVNEEIYELLLKIFQSEEELKEIIELKKEIITLSRLLEELERPMKENDNIYNLNEAARTLQRHDIQKKGYEEKLLSQLMLALQSKETKGILVNLNYRRK